MPRIFLSMIVKNESAVIIRCLESVVKWIDGYCIVDTGSTDNTVELIENFFRDKKKVGKVVVRPWVDFEHNRNESLAQARELAEPEDYGMCMDADEIFRTDTGFSLPNPMVASQYVTDIIHGVRFTRTRFYKLFKYEWWYPVHEVLCPVTPFQEVVVKLPLCRVDSTTDGARAKNPERWKEDAARLDEAIDTIESGKLWRGKALNLSRLYFYSANSHGHYRNYDMAIKRYDQRIALAHDFPEEAFQAYLAKAKLFIEMRSKSKAEIMGAMWEAYYFRPTRFEPLVILLRLAMKDANLPVARFYAKGLKDCKPPPGDLLFVEETEYEYAKKLAENLLNPTPKEAIDLAVLCYIHKNYEEVIAILNPLKYKSLDASDKFTYCDLHIIAYSNTQRVKEALVYFEKLLQLPIKKWAEHTPRLVGWYLRVGGDLAKLPPSVSKEYTARQETTTAVVAAVPVPAVITTSQEFSELDELENL